jgi:putative protein kinase ArgK-like GTPase of G3E family
VATKGEGIEALVEKIKDYIQTRSKDLNDVRKKRLISSMFRDIIGEKLFRIINKEISPSRYEHMIDKIYKKKANPYSMADEIIGKIITKSSK